MWRHYLCFFLSVILVVAATVPLRQWTTITSVPSFPFTGCAVPFVDDVLFVENAAAYVLHTATFTWTSVSARPVFVMGGLAEALQSNKAIFSSGFPVTRATHEVDLTTYTWTSKANRPSANQRCSSGSDGSRLWVVCAEFEEYTSALDTWTTRTPHPDFVQNSCGSYYDGKLVHIRYLGATHLYDVNSDTWTTRSAVPSTISYLFDSAEVVSGFLYFVDGSNGGMRPFYEYCIATDTWTTLDSAPTFTYGAATAITASGYLVAVGSYSALTTTHVFDTGHRAPPASVIGDPVVQTLHGRTHHLDLYPGVFNLLTTSTVTISAVVESLPTLPPDENTVMTVVAVAGEISGTIFAIDCSVGSLDATPFVCSTRKSSDVQGVFTLSTDVSVMTVSLPLFTVEIALSGCLVVSASAGGDSIVQTPAWLNVHVHPRLPVPHCAGLLCFDETLPVKDYEVRSGCVFESNPFEMAIASSNVLDVSLPRVELC